MRKAKFAMDFFDDGIAIDGYTFGDYWNGWDCPFFTFENAKKVVEAFGNTLQYDQNQDVFIYHDPQYMDDEDKDIFESVIIDNQKYYSVGGWNFCWYEVFNKESEAVNE
jgi:hypothetical protein